MRLAAGQSIEAPHRYWTLFLLRRDVLRDILGDDRAYHRRIQRLADERLRENPDRDRLAQSD